MRDHGLITMIDVFWTMVPSDRDGKLLKSLSQDDVDFSPWRRCSTRTSRRARARPTPSLSRDGQMT
jgi:hypothetical protein